MKAKISFNKSKNLNFFNAPSKKKKKSDVADSTSTNDLEIVTTSDPSVISEASNTTTSGLLKLIFAY